jgi:hypothetical protein
MTCSSYALTSVKATIFRNSAQLPELESVFKAIHAKKKTAYFTKIFNPTNNGELALLTFNYFMSQSNYFCNHPPANNKQLYTTILLLGSEERTRFLLEMIQSPLCDTLL